MVGYGLSGSEAAMSGIGTARHYRQLCVDHSLLAVFKGDMVHMTMPLSCISFMD